MTTRWLPKDELILLRLIAANRPFEKSEKTSKEKKWQLIHDAAVKHESFTKKDVSMIAMREHFKDLMKKFDPSCSNGGELSQLLQDLHEDMENLEKEKREVSTKKPSQAILNKTETIVLEQSKNSASSEVKEHKKQKTSTFTKEEDIFQANLASFLDAAKKSMEFTQTLQESQIQQLQSQTKLNYALVDKFLTTGDNRKKRKRGKQSIYRNDLTF